MLTRRLQELWERDRPAVMGIINVTPDSFSDGGRYLRAQAAIARGELLAAQGADVLDVGGESTRPDATPVSTGEEAERVLGVVAALATRCPACLISVDTHRAEVADAALAAGAHMVNDVSAGSDPQMFDVVARREAAVVLMHMRGEPRTMQKETHYDDVVAEVHGTLFERAEAALASGLMREQVMLDPGIGFGKDVEGNVRLLAALPDLATLGFAVVVGASRKSFIGRLTGAAVEERLPGSLAAVARAAKVQRALVRVHDVAETAQFLRVLSAIEGQPWTG